MPDLSHRVRAAIEAKARVAREAEVVASTSGSWIGPIYETLTISMGSVNPAVPAVFPGQLPFITELPSVVLRRCEADLRTLDRHEPGYPGEVEYSYHWEKAGPSGEMVEVRNAEPDEPYYCETCGEFWPCPEFLDRAAAYGVPVEEST